MHTGSERLWKGLFPAVLTSIMQGLGMSGRGAKGWIEKLRNLLLDGQTKIWQDRCAEVRGELTDEQAAQRETSRERALTLLMLLRQRRGMVKGPYPVHATSTSKLSTQGVEVIEREYVNALPFAALRRYIGALQQVLRTTTVRLSPLRLARECVQCNITTQYIMRTGHTRRESMPALNGSWNEANALALREVRAIRTDPIAGIRTDKRNSVYLTDMDTRTANSFRVPSRPMFERKQDEDPPPLDSGTSEVGLNPPPRSQLMVVGVKYRSTENRVHQEYWTGVPMHEYDVVMPGGMTHGPSIASCGTRRTGRVRHVGSVLIARRKDALRQRHREIAIIEARTERRRAQEVRERMRLRKATKDRDKQTNSARRHVENNGTTQSNKRRWAAWAALPPWGDNKAQISPIHQTTWPPLLPEDGRFDPTSCTSFDSS